MIFTKSWMEDSFLNLQDVSNQDLMQIFSQRKLHLNILKGSDEDSLFDLEVPENRPDLNCILGAAREASAGLLRAMKSPLPVSDLEDDSIFTHIDVDVPAESCRRYTLRMAVNCKVMPSPLFLKQRLQALHMESQNNLLDLAACVRQETGQPLRIFDRRLLKGDSFLIRDSYEGEMITAPDGSTKVLQTGIPLCCSEDFTPLSIAGMEDSQILDNCNELLIVCGDFAPQFSDNTAYSASCLSHDSMGILPAVDRFCSLLTKLGWGDILSGTLDLLNYVSPPRFIEGEIPESCRKAMVLQGFSFRDGQIQVPSFREDIRDSSDLQKEIQRNTLQ